MFRWIALQNLQRIVVAYLKDLRGGRHAQSITLTTIKVDHNAHVACYPRDHVPRVSDNRRPHYRIPSPRRPIDAGCMPERTGTRPGATDHTEAWTIRSTSTGERRRGCY
jgi:hypothetical protein